MNFLGPRANSAKIRQSSLDYGLGLSHFSGKRLCFFQVVPFSLGSGLRLNAVCQVPSIRSVGGDISNPLIVCELFSQFPPRQKSRVERLEAKVEPLFT